MVKRQSSMPGARMYALFQELERMDLAASSAKRLELISKPKRASTLHGAKLDDRLRFELPDQAGVEDEIERCFQIDEALYERQAPSHLRSPGREAPAAFWRVVSVR